MKLSIIIASISVVVSSYLASIYDIRVDGINGKQIDLGAYRGKKLIITPFDASAPDTRQLKYLDSLQENDKNIAVVAVPALDFASGKNLPNFTRLKDSLNLHFVISAPAFVKKIGKQQLLFKFLTTVDLNGHFDQDVEEADQLYFINSEGMLYSILKKETPRSVINEVRLQKAQ